MGLRDLLRRWTKGEDERAKERAQEESFMTPHERDATSQDFEARKDDTAVSESWPGSAASDAASGDLDDR